MSFRSFRIRARWGCFAPFVHVRQTRGPAATGTGCRRFVRSPARCSLARMVFTVRPVQRSATAVGLKGTMSQADLHFIRVRLLDGKPKGRADSGARKKTFHLDPAMTSVTKHVERFAGRILPKTAAYQSERPL